LPFITKPNRFQKPVRFKSINMKQDIIESGAIYHLFNRGNNKENIFIETKNYYYFLERFKKYILPIADVYSYCLLKNHFHLLLRIKDRPELPEKFKNKPHLAFLTFLTPTLRALIKCMEEQVAYLRNI